jgi:hypothetical protein
MKLEPWKRAERCSIRGELRQLAKEERKRQQKAVQVSVVAGWWTRPRVLGRSCKWGVARIAWVRASAVTLLARV